MPIPDHRMKDLSSSTAVTSEPCQVAGLYCHQVLDSPVDHAHTVAIDLRRRPQNYRDLGQPSIATTLARLTAQYGTESTALSKDQRLRLHLPLFGQRDDTSDHGGERFPPSGRWS